MEEPTKEEKEYFEKNFKWDRDSIRNPYVCKICGGWQTPLPYDMFRHYLTHSRLKEKNLKLLSEGI